MHTKVLKAPFVRRLALLGALLTITARNAAGTSAPRRPLPWIFARQGGLLRAPR